ncbi:TIGR03440 family protein [Terriglobus roseus DSM 18391]|uniref:TIGR03440 family protein n=1 Tax=Terriglobus roseus (strain DSM 18391 / NRRL B-41598 / KBS 63) TaxID=926566 RepID=I3ZBR2_TERRK|nr:TIGR03440 family protein [Terriglobus roseus DSM 18391]
MATMALSPAVSPAAGSANSLASALLVRYRAARAATSHCCAPLSAEDQMVQSCAEASPTKWHQAHTSWFFETFVLTPFLPGYRPFHPDFHWLFNSYYKSLGNEIPEKKLRASFSRPSLDQILAFRAHVDHHVDQLLQGQDVPEDALRRIVLGIQHEQQHLELLLTDIKHAFFTNPLHPVYRENASLPTRLPQPAQWVEFEGGLQQIGYPLDAADPLDFSFDNETPRHTVYLQPYALENRTVTCAEYLDFMNDNGYQRAELWLSEGWDTVESERWDAPLYWQRSPAEASGWRIFTLGGWRPLSDMLHTPVCHVSLFEADAFARWRGCRLPTEAEWEYAAASSPTDNGILLEDDALHPTASTSRDLTQMLGGCWEWTSSAYTGYPGYAPLPGALGEYNGKFMSSQIILRGGSALTPASHIRAAYRNFFSPATRWQISGIRLARTFADQATALNGSDQ